MSKKATPRPQQTEILKYTGGLLAVSAVPGAGKTYVLAALAANLIKRLGRRKTPAEVLIVTYTNAAANNFKSRLHALLEEKRILIASPGFRVRTLHGLASDILRERPALVGLASDFAVVDDREAGRLREEVFLRWWADNEADVLAAYTDPNAMNERRKWARSESGRPTPETDVQRYFSDVFRVFIDRAKDRALDPAALRAALDDAGFDLPLARMAAEIYERYQRALESRGAVDFADLSRRAIAALEADPAFLKRLQKRWPFILEDEAQDSSALQEHMLRLLSGGKNWVRVGDPNQAINTTFTTADPTFLKNFMRQPEVAAHTLSQAGRSAPEIFTLANEFAGWVTNEHPAEALRDALLYQEIQPVAKGDPQQNPAEANIEIFYQPGKQNAITSDGEITKVVTSLKAWLPDHPESTVAILVPENERGVRYVEALNGAEIPYEELLSSTTVTRAALTQLHTVLAFLARPLKLNPNAKATRLEEVYRGVWWPLHLGRDEEPGELGNKRKHDAAKLINSFEQVEGFLWPELADLATGEQHAERFGELEANDAELASDLLDFAEHVRRWMHALVLPVDQLVLLINQDLFTDPADLALGYKFAGLLRRTAGQYPDFRLPQFAAELDRLRTGERRMFGMESADAGYQPTAGRVTVATMHQAKGLEWDRVYVTGLSNYSIPSLEEDDMYLDEKPLFRGKLNLKAEALAQLEAALRIRGYEPGAATLAMREAFAEERLRLLYVALTRARRDLLLLWNMGRYGRNRASTPLNALYALHTAKEAERA